MHADDAACGSTNSFSGPKDVGVANGYYWSGQGVIHGIKVKSVRLWPSASCVHLQEVTVRGSMVTEQAQKASEQVSRAGAGKRARCSLDEADAEAVAVARPDAA